MSLSVAGPLAACLMTAFWAGGAPAVPAPPPAQSPAQPAAESSLTLTLHDAEGVSRSVQLICEPAAGTHPRAAEACAAVQEAEGDFTRLPVKDEICPMIYSPLQAEARGHWRGEPVEFTAEYSNRCRADTQSGGVFRF